MHFISCVGWTHGGPTVNTQYHEDLNWKRDYILHYCFLTTFDKFSEEEHIEQYIIHENANLPDHRVLLLLKVLEASSLHFTLVSAANCTMTDFQMTCDVTKTCLYVHVLNSASGEHRDTLSPQQMNVWNSAKDIIPRWMSNIHVRLTTNRNICA